MFKKIALLSMSALFLLSVTSCDTLTGVLGSVTGSGGTAALTNAQVTEGLKEALKQGVSKGVTTLSATDGFFKNPSVKVLFPPEANKVEKTLRDLGLGGQVDKAIEKLNRAAEDAAVGAKNIFVKAITNMTVSDAMGILMGEKNACTSYLKKTTSTDLFNSFKPVIKNSLNKVGALTAWNEVITRYNKIPMVQKVEPDLDTHVTNKAIDGLFSMVEKEEENIRANPMARATDLMKKVFAKQDK